MSSNDPVQCPPDLLQKALATAQASDTGGLTAVEALLQRYPSDPVLSFLRGSLLAGLRRYEEAEAAMSQAIAIAPGYDVARFQLGSLQFTSGRADRAAATWGPLLALSEDHPLRLFAEGMLALGRDDFARAAALLAEGVALNSENEPLNGDMRILLARIAERQAEEAEGEPVSSAHLLLQQSATKRTMH